MSASETLMHTYCSALEWNRRGVEEMRFRLTYRGPLRAHRVPKEGCSDKMAPHIHEVRRHFHPQLKSLWETNQFLREHKSWPTDYGLLPQSDGSQVPLVDIVAQSHVCNGFSFVPLVRGDWSLECNLSILFLKKDTPGSGLIHRGDLDNRLKTLIDALRFPTTPYEAGGAVPLKEETPLFCLLEKDDYVTGLSVETDKLLESGNYSEDESTVNLIITVEIRPYYVTTFNLAFG